MQDLISGLENCPYNLFLIQSSLPFSAWPSSNLLTGTFLLFYICHHDLEEEGASVTVCVPNRTRGASEYWER